MAINFFRAAVLALALAVSACSENGVAADKNADGKDAKATAEASIPVEVAKPARGEMLAMYSGTATLEAEADAKIVAKVGGEVLRILVEEGDHVKAGQVLARSRRSSAALPGRADPRRAWPRRNVTSIARWNCTRRAWFPPGHSKASSTISTTSAPPTTSRV